MALKLQTMKFFLQTVDNAIFDEFKGNNSALSQQLWDTQLYHTFLNSSYTYLTRNNY